MTALGRGAMASELGAGALARTARPRGLGGRAGALTGALAIVLAVALAVALAGVAWSGAFVVDSTFERGAFV